MTDGPLPPMRTDLELIPGTYEDEPVFVVRDDLALYKDEFVVKQEFALIGYLLNGQRTLQELQTELIEVSGGTEVPLGDLQQLVDLLDQHYLLDSDRYREARTVALDAYQREGLRKPVFAGQAYPENPKELTALLDAILAQGEQVEISGKLKALAAPHIDLQVGQQVYGSAYRHLQGQEFKRIIILGTGHRIADGFFSLTEKDFETPLGTVSTDREAVRKLRQAGSEASSRHDIAHKREHAIEFQLLFLQHILKSDFKAVPILCGNFSGLLECFDRAGDMPDVDDLLNALRELAQDKDTLVVAGVDFSHIGRKFGHEQTGLELADEARKHDQALLESLIANDPKALWAESLRVNDQYHVCGFAALASLLELLPDVQGNLLDYDMWQEEPTESAVSYAALAFTEES